MKAETYRKFAADLRDLLWMSIGLFAGTGNYWFLAETVIVFLLHVWVMEKAYKLEQGRK